MKDTKQPIMTAKDKATHLVANYTFAVTDSYLGGSIDRAKKCALICVNEMIGITSAFAPIEAQDYWEEVKYEIEKL